ncbi:Major facilitator superfamily domain-containing protein 6 [Seminavis robusta]|uniref:Major facilitator superfamily domain-containing protein 6 n=1 Tax=Seminavis robusta TaxID=568900 RepID=A0A9N8HEM7_9STRA|nr:Major facilitator superfamily domain-containing protein 6 [Seminavis robusta]|eukprot:Sro311_g114240.1 Major facilitator superfamily domain-containing protein 6 (359) ;mRNA; r:21137-22213
MCLSLDKVQAFEVILFLIIGISVFCAGSVLDAHTLDFLGERHHGMYGTIRLWTAVSWGFGAIVLSYLTDIYGFTVNFYVFGAVMTLQLVFFVFGLPARSKSEQEFYEKAQRQKENIHHPTNFSKKSAASEPMRWSALWDIMTRLPVIFWLIEAALVVAGIIIVDSFLFVYLQNDLLASTSLCGWTVGVTVLLELPIFHFSQQLLSWLGHDVLLIVSMISYSSRIIGYTMLTPETVNWVIAWEVLHGITFACMWIATVDYADSIAPKGWSTTVQSIVNGVTYHIGGGVGPIVAGQVMNRFGARTMFRGMGLIVGSVMLLHLVVMICFGRVHDKCIERIRLEREAEAQETDDEEEEFDII